MTSAYIFNTHACSNMSSISINISEMIFLGESQL